MAGGPRRVIWSRRANRELDEALEFVTEDSPAAAGKSLEAALQSAGSLSELSARGRRVPEIDGQDVREIFVFRYRMLYEITSSEVQILAFVHGARDFGRWWNLTP